MTAGEPFEARRGRLIGLAYRMLGSRADAEDAVQDAWIRWAEADRARIENPDAWLITVVTRLCLDRIKSVRRTREIYVGPWLPEPVLDTEALSPHTATELADNLSFALMMALERLSPLERAAFLLHDVFDENFHDVAQTLGRSEAACRQLAARARRSVQSEGVRFSPSPETHRKLLQAFAGAAMAGDIDALKSLLQHDAIAITDGGGKKRAALNPIYGADNIARFFTGLARKFAKELGPLSLELAELNGAPGLILRAGGEVDQTMTIAVADGKIQTLYTVRNPDKLTRLQ
jgi:RNA polymerase sigma-70 factor (ECF subfamily)